MERAKMVLQKLLRPGRWVLLFLPPISFAALIFIFAARKTEGAPAYLIYCMSAYSLTIWTAAFPRLTKRIRYAIINSRIMRKAAASRITGRYLTDIAFRGSVSIYQGMAVDFIAAMMSILGLQTAMISRFSEDGENYRKMMNAITGSAVYGIVIVIAAYMLLRSRTLRKKVAPVEQIRE